MKTLFYLPSLIAEFIKARLLPYHPSDEYTRLMEENVRNEIRLGAYYAKRAIYGRKD